MRLTEFISSVEKEVRKMAKIIHRDCQPFLQASNYLEYRLYRGVEISPKTNLDKFDCRTERIPRDSPRIMHSIADDWFYQKTGIRFRSNAVFCVGDKLATLTYGKPHLLLPIGNFDFCWSPVYSDLYESLEDVVNWKKFVNQPESEQKAAKKKFIGALENGKYEFNTSIASFRRGVENDHEMMIHCKQYYLLTTDGVLVDAIVQELRKL